MSDKFNPLKKKLAKLFAVLFLAGAVVMGILIANWYKFDWVTAAVQGLLSGAITGLSVNDMLITIIASFTRGAHESSHSPHNLFFHDKALTQAAEVIVLEESRMMIIIPFCSHYFAFFGLFYCCFCFIILQL